MKRILLLLALALSADAADPGGLRLGKRRLAQPLNLRKSGGTGATELAVELGLKWLATHQDLGPKGDGRWDADGFAKHDPDSDRCPDPGSPRHDVGVSSLALLAFLGAGYLDRPTDPEIPLRHSYEFQVRRGLDFLMESQDAEGRIGRSRIQRWIYDHALATLALVEAGAMTRDPRYLRPAQRGLDYLAAHRNPAAGWRYVPRDGETDTAVTTWCLMGIETGRAPGLRVDPEARAGTRGWLDRVVDPRTGRYGYLDRSGGIARPPELEDAFPPGRSESMTAAAVWCRLLMGETPGMDPLLGKSVQRLLGSPPTWNPDRGEVDMIEWHFAHLANHRIGGRKWGGWNRAFAAMATSRQHPKGSGSKTGSWDPAGPWGIAEGGRVYSTALMVLNLEVYYRYARD